jgi:hypothetical protein
MELFHFFSGGIIALEWLAWLQLYRRRGKAEARRHVAGGHVCFKDRRYSDQEIEAVCNELDEAEQLGAIPAAEPSTVS